MYLLKTFKNCFQLVPFMDHQATYVIALNLPIYIVINASDSSTYSSWVITVGIGTINQNFLHNYYLQLHNNFNLLTNLNHKILHHISLLLLSPSSMLINFVPKAKICQQTGLGMLISYYLLNLSLIISQQGIHL